MSLQNGENSWTQLQKENKQKIAPKMVLFLIHYISYTRFMNKKIIIIFFAIIILISAIFIFSYISKNKETSVIVSNVAFDAKNSSFIIENNGVTLKNGISEIPSAPGSASKIITRYFGNEATGDLNSDGMPDTAFLITQNSGGSGTFFYVVVALNTTAGYKTTNAFLIGDRIAPQTTEINSDTKELYVNYADRKPGEPMTTEPSVGKTLYLKLTEDGILEKVIK